MTWSIFYSCLIIRGSGRDCLAEHETSASSSLTIISFCDLMQKIVWPCWYESRSTAQEGSSRRMKTFVHNKNPLVPFAPPLPQIWSWTFGALHVLGWGTPRKAARSLPWACLPLKQTSSMACCCFSYCCFSQRSLSSGRLRDFQLLTVSSPKCLPQVSQEVFHFLKLPARTQLGHERGFRLTVVNKLCQILPTLLIYNSSRESESPSTRSSQPIDVG